MNAAVDALFGPRSLGIVAVVAAAVALVQSVRLWWRRAAPAWRLRARAERASEGEREAGPMLEARGYAIVGRQVAQSFRVGVDGRAIDVSLRADFVVERGGRRFVADVKTGLSAPRVESAATRRQLLEYRCAFDVDGVLLVDADRETVREIVFALPGHAPASSASAWLAVGVAIGVALACAVALAVR